MCILQPRLFCTWQCAINFAWAVSSLPACLSAPLVLGQRGGIATLLCLKPLFVCFFKSNLDSDHWCCSSNDPFLRNSSWISAFFMMIRGTDGMWGSWRVCCSQEGSSSFSSSFGGIWKLDCWELMCSSSPWHLKLHILVNNSAVMPFSVSPARLLPYKAMCWHLGRGCACFVLYSGCTRSHKQQ